MVRRVREPLVDCSISLTPSMILEIRKLATADDISLRLWIREALEDVVKIKRELNAKRKQEQAAQVAPEPQQAQELASA